MKVIRKMAKERFPGEEGTILKKAAHQYDAFWEVTPDIRQEISESGWMGLSGLAILYGKKSEMD